jgi:hypothetical protein
MTLTRRLYRFDEVRAALLWCLRVRRLQEALFWLQELEDSLYGGEARRVLLWAWVLTCGMRNMSWLVTWSAESHTREGRRLLAYQLMKSDAESMDSSIWCLFWSVAVLDNGVGRLWWAWRAMCCVEDPVEFWQPLVDASTDERLDSVLDALQQDMKSYNMLARCVACAVSHCWSQLPKTCWWVLPLEIPSHLTTAVESAVQTHVRGARAFEIPWDCLFGMCWRGLGGATDLAALRLDDLQGAPCWKVGAIAAATNDNVLEEFYDTAFKGCDVPDEWSAADRRKSHGEAAGPGPLNRWWRNWVGNERLFVFGRDYNGLMVWLRGQRIEGGLPIMERILELYKGLAVTAGGSGVITPNFAAKKFTCTT